MRDEISEQALKARFPALREAAEDSQVMSALLQVVQPCVLIARRSEQTRVHGGLWELAPSGGIDPPASAPTLTLEYVRTQLATEMREELGLKVDEDKAEKKDDAEEE